VPRALKAAAEPAGDVLAWPGTELLVGSDNEGEADAALVLIGMLCSDLSVSKKLDSFCLF
jgi:hypothetical protein